MTSALTPKPDAALSEPVVRYASRSLSDNSRRSYGSMLRSWEEWCAGRAMPAYPVIYAEVAEWLAHRADQGLSCSTMYVSLAALKEAHKLHGHPWAPTEALRRTVEGIRRVRAGDLRKKARAMTMEELAVIATAEGIPERFKAAALCAFGAALRREELAALEVGDLQPDDRGLLVRVRVSKTDQTGMGAAVAISGPLGIQARDAWLRWAALRPARFGQSAFGYGNGRVFSDELKRWGSALGFPPGLSGHSMRRGLAHAAKKAGAPLADIMAQGRWKSAGVAMGYMQEEDAFNVDVTGRLGTGK